MDGGEAVVYQLQGETADTSMQGSGQAGAAWPVRYRWAVARHYGAVYRLAAGLLRDSAAAEDVTQEAFTRFWERGESIRKPRAWLLRVARNAALDRLRRHGARVLDADTARQDLAEHRDGYWRSTQDELSQRLQRALARLDEPYRTLVLLFDLQGEDGATCATTLDLSPEQVRVYLYRARRRLRLDLEERQ